MSKNKVGPKGQAIQIQMIGTDASVNDHSVILATSQTNNEFKSSDISDFNAAIYATSGLDRNGKLNRLDVTGFKRRYPMLRSLSPSGRSSLSDEECENMIRTIYSHQQTHKPMDLKKISASVGEICYKGGEQCAFPHLILIASGLHKVLRTSMLTFQG